MGLDNWQCDHTVHVHQFRVRPNNRMFVASCHIGGDITEIRFVAIFHRLFQQSVHNLPLDWNDFSVRRYDHIHGSDTERSEVVVGKERTEREIDRGKEGQLNVDRHVHGSTVSLFLTQSCFS